MPKSKKALEAEAEVEAGAETEVVVETSDLESPDDQGESEELDAIFEDAIAAAPLEEGGEGEDKPKASESAPVESEGEPAPETSKAEPAVADEGVVEPEPSASVEEPPKEEPPAEQPAVEIPAPLDPAQVQADFEKWRSDAETLLAERQYNLTEEQAEELDANPSAVMPKLAARLHMEVMQQSVALIARMIPSIMQNVQALQTDQNSKEIKFFEQWPELKVHRDEVVRHGSVYVQMNPNASFDEFVRDVGAQVAIAKKVDLSARETVTETLLEPAHKPIASGGGAGTSRPNAEPGVFEQLYEDASATDSDFQ